MTIIRAIATGVLLPTLILSPGDLRALSQQPSKQEPKKPQEPQQEYSISVEVPLVNVDVVVTDANGNFIPGLKKENFRVVEDGAPQPITNFTPTEAPITIVLLIEFSKLGWGFYAYNATFWASGFLNQLNKNDWVALVTYDMKTRIEADFTRDKSTVNHALSQLFIPGFSEANLFDAVVETLDRLKEVKGKKSILILASGFDTFSKKTLDQTLRELRQSDVTIFAVGVARALQEALDTAGMVGGAGRVGYLQAENQLNSFARMTGGRAWFPRFQGELPGIFSEVAAMLRNQYSLSYTPANRARDGKFRKIKVELVGDDGQPLIVMDQRGKKVKYVVYAREGYLAPKGGVAD